MILDTPCSTTIFIHRSSQVIPIIQYLSPIDQKTDLDMSG